MNLKLDQQTMNLLRALESGYQKILGTNLAGIYLHGSIALGGYRFTASDLDYLAVVHRPLRDDEKLKLLDFTLEELMPLAPKKGLEMHVLLVSEILKADYPKAFELHFSPMFLQDYLADPQKYVRTMKGTDPDLGAHLHIVNACGIVLTGKPVRDVFAKVPEEVYRESILYDIRDTSNELSENLAYVILNLCRTWAYFQEGKVLSKQAGGHWGKKNLKDEYRSIIDLALKEYESEADEKSFFSDKDMESARKLRQEILAINMQSKRRL